jgi:hypothetical protein
MSTVLTSDTDASALGVYNVKASGAKGDGVTDDTTAIQTALTDAAAVGGVCFFPNGTYMISSPLSVNGPVSIGGESRDATTIRIIPSSYGNFGTGGSPSSSYGILQPASTGNVTEVYIHDLRLDANHRHCPSQYTSLRGYASCVFTNSQWVIERVEIYDHHDFGIGVFAGDQARIIECEFFLGGLSDGIGGGYPCSNLTVRGCTWHSNYVGASALDHVDDIGLIFSQNYIYSSYDVIIEGCTGALVTNNVFGAWAGIQLQSDQNYLTFAVGVTLSATVNAGATSATFSSVNGLKPGYLVLLDGATAELLTVSSNWNGSNPVTFTTSTQHQHSSGSTVLWGSVQNPRDVLIADNIMYGSGNHGIKVTLGGGAFHPVAQTTLAQGIVIARNKVDGANYSGIVWQADDNSTSNGGNQIIDNTIYNCNYSNTSGEFNDSYGFYYVSGINVTQAFNLKVARNSIVDFRSTPQHVHALQVGREDSPGSGLAAVDVQDNHLSGSSGTIYRSGTNINATPIARRNTGYNPVGKFATQPTVPSSGSQYLNALGGDATVFVSAGTAANGVTVEVGNEATGLTIPRSTQASIRVPAGQSVMLAWSGAGTAPTWLWFGD